MPLKVLRYEDPHFVLAGDRGEWKIHSGSLSDSKKDELHRLAKGGMAPAVDGEADTASPKAGAGMQSFPSGGPVQEEAPPADSQPMGPEPSPLGPDAQRAVDITGGKLDPSVYADPHAVRQILAQQKTAENIKTTFGKSPEQEAKGKEFVAAVHQARGDVAPAPPAPPAPSPQSEVAPAQAQQQPQMPPMPTIPDLPGAGMYRDIEHRSNEAQKQVGVAADAEAKAKAAYYEHMAPHLDAFQKYVAEAQPRVEGDIKSAQTKWEQAAQDAASTKIDPDHYWSSKSTAGKVSTGIGLILAGIGSGLTGQPNLAAQFIQRNIDRDIDAQKSNLETKNNLVNYFYKKTGNIQDAAKFAMAYQYAAVSAYAQQAANATGTQQAMAAAQLIKAHASQQALPLLAQVHIANAQNNLALYDARLKRYGLEMQQRFMSQYMNAQGGGGGGPRYIPSNSTPPMLTEPSLKGIAEMEKEKSGRMVHLPELGGVTFANDPETARKANAALPSLHTMEQELSTMERLGKKHSFSINSPWPNEDKARFKVAQESVNLHMNQLMQQQRFTHEENTLYKPMVGDAKTFLMNQKAGGAQINALRNLVNQRRQAIYSEVGMRIPGRPSETPIAKAP